MDTEFKGVAGSRVVTSTLVYCVREPDTASDFRKGAALAAGAQGTWTADEIWHGTGHPGDAARLKQYTPNAQCSTFCFSLAVDSEH